VAKDYAGNIEPLKAEADARTTIELEVTSIDELLKFPLTIYPNPTSGNLQVQFKLDRVKNIQIEILDLSGKRVWSKKSQEYYPGENALEVDMKSFLNGIYFLKVISDQEISTFKILKN
jgi:hypothetical protein